MGNYMHQLRKKASAVGPWLSKSWVQWLVAIVLSFSVSWLYMGRSVTECSTTTTALNSDSTGGFAWLQWASNNSVTWGHTDVSNYPQGESLVRPQFITSEIALFMYRLFSAISTPICGLNIMVLLGYMSSFLLMFGLVKWLLKRFDIALFAGYAAGFVPYHQLKAQTHIIYMYGSIFIASIWAYLWFIKKPSYKRAAVLSLVNAVGYYFDGYFVLISSVVIAILFLSSFIFDFFKWLKQRQLKKTNLGETRRRAKYLLLSVVLLALLLLPILRVQQTQGDTLKNSLAASRSDIKSETVGYAARPSEFFLPSYNNPLMPTKYQTWRLLDQHGSNPSEDTLFVGFTVIVLALVSLVALIYRKNRISKINSLPYVYLVSVVGLVLAACVWFSMPSRYTLLGHVLYSPSRLLIKFTSNWRVMARFFLAIHPLAVILAGMGLYVLTKSWKKIWQVGLVLLCTAALFLEYLPPTFNPTADLYKDSPKIYLQLANDPTVKVIAEYPITEFIYAPAIFTFQEVHKKRLLNASDSLYSRGPFDESIAGLNDAQTLGVLKALGIDVITSYDKGSTSPGLIEYYPPSLNNKVGVPAIYSYRIKDSVKADDSVLLAESGYIYFVVDNQQVSHRALKDTGNMKIQALGSGIQNNKYNAGFYTQAYCSNAFLTITQDGIKLWSGNIGSMATAVDFEATVNKDINLTTTCPIDIVNMRSKVLD